MKALIVIGLLALATLNAVSKEPQIVAIIGTGDLGGSLGPPIAAIGYRVIYGSRDPSRESVQDLVKLTGMGASATTQLDAAQSADIVLLAVPWPPMEQVAQNLGELDGKIVIDASFPFRQAADGYMESSVETSSAEMIQAWNPGAKVVKVSFPGSYLIDEPLALGDRASVDIAADDRRAKEAVAQIVAEIGLDPFDAGPLRNSRYIEALGILYMVPLMQGRKEGIEFFYGRSSYGPCVWKVTDYYEPVVDHDDLAQFPESDSPPKPCSTHKTAN